MDGRVQEPVIKYLKQYFGIQYVDMITEPGPVKTLAEHAHNGLLDSIQKRLSISIQKHRSVGIAIAAHADCQGNPASPEEQKKQLAAAVSWLKQEYPHLPALALWVDEEFQVHPIS